MATKQTYRNDPFVGCVVDGCSGNAHYKARGAAGYCATHWYRKKMYGDPLAGETPHGEAERFMRKVVFTYAGNDCLLWPYARNSAGYGHLQIKGSHYMVHRLACTERHGTPVAGTYAAHSCGNGHNGCCNPMHVRWATPAENSADAARHGTLCRGERVGGSKLTEDAIRNIRASNEPQDVIAARFGVTPSNISYIRTRKSWKHVI